MKKSHFIGVSEEMADVAVADEEYLNHNISLLKCSDLPYLGDFCTVYKIRIKSAKCDTLCKIRQIGAKCNSQS